jgi:hypothetical protein
MQIDAVRKCAHQIFRISSEKKVVEKLKINYRLIFALHKLCGQTVVNPVDIFFLRASSAGGMQIAQ